MLPSKFRANLGILSHKLAGHSLNLACQVDQLRAQMGQIQAQMSELGAQIGQLGAQLVA